MKGAVFVCESRAALKAVNQVTAHVALFRGHGDFAPSRPVPVFKSKVIIFDRCDKNFVYYWFRVATKRASNVITK